MKIKIISDPEGSKVQNRQSNNVAKISLCFQYIVTVFLCTRLSYQNIVAKNYINKSLVIYLFRSLLPNCGKEQIDNFFFFVNQTLSLLIYLKPKNILIPFKNFN